MPIDLESETIITFVQAAKSLPKLRNNRPVSPPTLWRWSKHGVKAGDRIIRLETTSLGGRAVTSKEAMSRFLNRCAAARGADCTEKTRSIAAIKSVGQISAEAYLNASGF